MYLAVVVESRHQPGREHHNLHLSGEGLVDGPGG